MESVARMRAISDVDKVITAADRPYVRAKVTLLPELTGGRSWAQGHYQPHVVVEPSTRRTPAPSGSEVARRYLDVEFYGGEQYIGPGQTTEVKLVMLCRGVNYSAIVRGATFTVREGPAVVGYGCVI
jgi:hypothetical protein